jgi:hypothetical protein
LNRGYEGRNAPNEAQKYSGGCPGAYPVLLEVDDESQVTLSKPWDFIQALHDFELHDEWHHHCVESLQNWKKKAL